ncbi:helix-turn-helix domain-containing protein [Streptomyces sp. NPDC007025]|uniref:helix-turn-helix domain-containing protein n=1 Tax=Streptomyces sp. NPDC007025 TaxID=3364771 RepID=UPI003698BE65
MSPRELAIGSRIKRARKRSGRTQAAVAGLCGITEAYLSQIERGLKLPSIDVLVLLAREVDEPLASLLDDAPVVEAPAPQTAPAVAAALVAPSCPAGDQSPSPQALRERVENIWRVWQTSPTRFSEAAELLPDLIAEVEQALRFYRGSTEAEKRRQIATSAADLYGMVRSYCRRTGRIDLSLMVADRARRAAEDAEDHLRIAAAQWNLGHVLLGDGQPEGAEAVAREAIEQLSTHPTTSETVAMTGALELVTATSAIRRKAWWTARELLDGSAARHAQQVGEGNVMWTVFGPTNVALHQLSVEMEAGQTSDALRLADQVNIAHLPSRERRFTFRLEVARCYAPRREDAAVLVHLLDLEELAPEDVMHSGDARELISTLLRRVRPTYRKQVVGLADRMGVS